MAVANVSSVNNVTPIDPTGGPGTHESAMVNTQKPDNMLANGVTKPAIRPTPPRDNRLPTIHTTGVCWLRLANSSVPSAMAMQPSAVRIRSNPMPGLPLGKAENSLCSANLLLAL